MKRFGLGLLVQLLELAFLLFLCCTPLTAVWLLSSLAAYQDGPRWLAPAAGLALCPVLPLIWELLSLARRQRTEGERPRTTVFERLAFRVFGLSLLFLVITLAAYPRAGFLALSTRGDWVLDTPWARQHLNAAQRQTGRTWLLRCANGLEGLYRAVSPNRYQQLVDPTFTAEPPAPGAQPRPAPLPQPAPPPSPAPGQTPPPAQPAPPPAPDWAAWPAKLATLHPAIGRMPASAEASIDSIAQYLAAQETAPLARLRLVHDYVADRIAYDVGALAIEPRPSQHADRVLRERKGVCAGYANLTAAIARKIGLRVVVITGDTREDDGDLAPSGHVWNAAQIDGIWYLLDVTWDSGVANDNRFVKQYRTRYFCCPPEVFILDHLPDQANWQLLGQPLSRAEFVHQPTLKPAFFSAGLTLVSPTTRLAQTASEAVVEVKNPRQVRLAATLIDHATSTVQQRNDQASTAADVRLAWPLPAPGRYSVILITCKPDGSLDEDVAWFEFERTAP